MITRRSAIKQLAAFTTFIRCSFGLRGALPQGLGVEAGRAPGARWSLKKGPLLTRWSALVDPSAPLPLYPRPQMVRKEWLNLNGVWEYQPGEAEDGQPFGKPLSETILVPFPVESALSGVMEHHDRLWYRRLIKIPGKWKGKRILLHFGAVDYEAQVFVNGKQVMEHQGGYDPFTCDITPYLSGKAEDELVVRVFDPTEAGGQPRGKQNTHPVGITYTPTTGIWQTVWLEPVSDAYIEGLTTVPDIDRGRLKVQVNANGRKAHTQVALKVKSGGDVVASVSGAPHHEIAIPIPEARLWSPDDPFLYTIDVEMTEGGKVVDSVSSYFGMRKTSVEEVDGERKLLLNNKFVFQAGPLDQGFWPDGIYTAPTDEAIKNDILQMKAMGFNMVRKHIKVEPARWYYWTDKLGLLVWQDMPSANSYPAHRFVPPPVDKQAFAKELKSMVQGLINAPSIVLWTIFNESQGQFDTEQMVNLVRSVDSSRPVNEASGGTIFGFGDVNDIHNYPLPAVRPSNGRQAMTCGEFGGIGWLIAEHSWSQKGGGYVDVSKPEDFIYLYAEYLERANEMRQHRNLSAIVYTQLTDVMTEVNGLMTYDRVLKVPADILRRVNLHQFIPPGYRTVLPTAESPGEEWKYVTQKPDGQWTDLRFDDSRWSTGAGAFGSHGERVGTQWTTMDIWLRRHFNPGAVTAEMLENLVLKETAEAAVEIFINGVVMVPQRMRHVDVGVYQNLPLPDAVRRAVLPDQDNVIAVHCKRDGKNQYFDAGLSIRIPSQTQVLETTPA